MKNLKVVSPVLDLKKIVIVDNISQNFTLQKENGIEIKSWYAGDTKDKEIIKLERVLISLLQLDDVRTGIKNI